MSPPASAAPASGGLDREAASSRYRDNAARHLIGIARDLQSRALRRLGSELGYEGLRPSLGPFLSLVWTEPRPLVLLAEQLSISKQACSQLARLAEREGYLERVRAPRGGRAVRVRLTRRGRALVDDAVQVIVDAEAVYAELIGAERFRRFRDACAALFAGLGIQAQTDPTLDAAAHRSIGVLPLIALRIEEALMEATRAKGHSGLRLSHGQVLALIGHEGARISEMARIHGVSRQAISATTRDLESLGYVVREAGLADGRGVRVRLSRRGERLIRDSIAALAELERSFRQILGSRRLSDLETTAADLYRALHLEEEIFGAVAPTGLAGRARSDSRGPASDSELGALAASLARRLGARDAARLGRLLAAGRTDRGRGSLDRSRPSSGG